jgi:hypothetical protein
VRKDGEEYRRPALSNRSAHSPGRPFAVSRSRVRAGQVAAITAIDLPDAVCPMAHLSPGTALRWHRTGLLGYFVNAHREPVRVRSEQWLDDAAFGRPLNPKAKDTIIGSNDATEVSLRFVRHGAPQIKITRFSRFVTTQAVAYCSLPSVTALKFIAALQEHGPSSFWKTARRRGR